MSSHAFKPCFVVWFDPLHLVTPRFSFFHQTLSPVTWLGLAPTPGLGTSVGKNPLCRSHIWWRLEKELGDKVPSFSWTRLLGFIGDDGAARVYWELELGPCLPETQALLAISLNLFLYVGFIKTHFAFNSLNSCTLHFSGAACQLLLNKTEKEKK